MCAPSQLETLQCNVISHWLGAFTKWSLHVSSVVTAFQLCSCWWPLWDVYHHMSCAYCVVFIVYCIEKTLYNDICITHWTCWGRVTHMVRKLAKVGSDNGLSPNRRQAIIWTSVILLLIGSLGTSFRKIWIKIQQFSYKKINLKMLSAKWQPFCLSLNVMLLLLSMKRGSFKCWMHFLSLHWRVRLAFDLVRLLKMKYNWKCMPNHLTKFCVSYKLCMRFWFVVVISSCLVGFMGSTYSCSAAL